MRTGDRRSGGRPDRRVRPARQHDHAHDDRPARRPVGPPGKAKIRKDGTAVAPADAPAQIQTAIAAANAIHTLPYVWGGGHRTFFDSGYDCSGAVSYVLHAAGLLASPMTSGGLASSWGVPGKGRWITVYGNASHAYMVIAGKRFDTSAGGDRWNQGCGPRWRKKKRKPAASRASTSRASRHSVARRFSRT